MSFDESSNYRCYLFIFQLKKMSLFRSNHFRLLNQRCSIIFSPSTIFIRHATEIRSRRIVPPDNSKSKQRKNTVNPIAQVKKLGDKAGRIIETSNRNNF